LTLSFFSNKERSPSVDPRFQLKLRGFATPSTLMSTIKQLPAEADSTKNCSQNTFSLFDTYCEIGKRPYHTSPFIPEKPLLYIDR
jgi:hypothetical protein